MIQELRMNEADTNQFEAHRPLMFSIAYRMLGSATEAEDIVQEAYLRYQGTAQTEIVSHKAFLSTVVTRLCLNQLQSARSQREVYIGPWLPEPILTESHDLLAPAPQVEQTELHESLSIAFLALMEQLTPLERAVFLLREVFDYEYAEIAEIIGREEGACRKMFSRAKKHISEHRPRFQATPEAHRQLLEQFVQAVGTGELDGLMQLLSDDVTLWADGGGKSRGAALYPVRGRDAVARFVLASVRLPEENYYGEVAQVNGEPGLILRTKSNVLVVLSITVDQGRVSGIQAISNPDKLTWVNEITQADPENNTENESGDSEEKSQ
jgi:RNA polymerase sigma-70 factor (ECF subfamily)